MIGRFGCVLIGLVLFLPGDGQAEVLGRRLGYGLALGYGYGVAPREKQRGRDVQDVQTLAIEPYLRLPLHSFGDGQWWYHGQLEGLLQATVLVELEPKSGTAAGGGPPPKSGAAGAAVLLAPPPKLKPAAGAGANEGLAAGAAPKTGAAAGAASPPPKENPAAAGLVSAGLAVDGAPPKLKVGAAGAALAGAPKLKGAVAGAAEGAAVPNEKPPAAGALEGGATNCTLAKGLALGAAEAGSAALSGRCEGRLALRILRCAIVACQVSEGTQHGRGGGVAFT